MFQFKSCHFFYQSLLMFWLTTIYVFYVFYLFVKNTNLFQSFILMYFKLLFLSLLTNFVLHNQICQFIHKFRLHVVAFVVKTPQTATFSGPTKRTVYSLWDISANRKQSFLKRIKILKMRAAKHMRAQTTLSVTCLSPLLLPSRPTRRMQFIKTNVLETILKFQQSVNLDETKKSRNFKDVNDL